MHFGTSLLLALVAVLVWLSFVEMAFPALAQGPLPTPSGRRSPERHRPPPNLPTTIPLKRNVAVGQQPQRRPAGRCRSVGVRSGVQSFRSSSGSLAMLATIRGTIKQAPGDPSTTGKSGPCLLEFNFFRAHNKF